MPFPIPCAILFSVRNIVYLQLSVIILFLSPWTLASSNTETKALLAFLEHLPSQPTKRVISGQNEIFPAGQASLDSIHTTTGFDPGLLGTHYDFPVAKNRDATNAALLRHWKNGGLVTISVGFDNPMTGGREIDTTKVDLDALWVRGTKLNATWMAEVDAVAKNLQQFQDKGVVVLFRPFHEMNGDWFWWQTKNPAENKSFQSLWRHLFDYLTAKKQLHNLLWVYSPNAYSGRYLELYPGDAFVDIVGLDYYSLNGQLPKVDGYDQLLSLRKPFALTELSPIKSDWHQPPNPSDYTQLLIGIKKNMPKTIFWMAWDGVWGMDQHLKVKEVLADPWVINLQDLQGSIHAHQ